MTHTYISRKIIISTLSGLCLAIIGFFFLLNKKFKKHPYSLFAYACLLQSVYFFCHYSNFLICLLNLSLSLEWSKFNFNPDYEDIFFSFKTLLIMWKTICISMTYMQLTANSIIFIDLYLTLKNPFYPRKKRMLAYNLILIVVMIISSSTLLLSIANEGTSLNLYDSKR